jgi:hypothetical protein
MTTKADILRSIRLKCLECSCGQPGEVRGCRITACALWPFRLGQDPEPGPARGCAKPSLPRGIGDHEKPGRLSGCSRTTLPTESLLGRNGFGEREAIGSVTFPTEQRPFAKRDGYTGNSVEGPTPGTSTATQAGHSANRSSTRAVLTAATPSLPDAGRGA